jgi:CBS domain-containing protein
MDVRDVMTSRFERIDSSTSLRRAAREMKSLDVGVEDAARRMEEREIRRLIVCDHERTPVGIVSLGDLAVKTGEDKLYGETLERIPRFHVR